MIAPGWWRLCVLYGRRREGDILLSENLGGAQVPASMAYIGEREYSASYEHGEVIDSFFFLFD
jgi:hypothetical protein